MLRLLLAASAIVLLGGCSAAPSPVPSAAAAETSPCPSVYTTVIPVLAHSVAAGQVIADSDVVTMDWPAMSVYDGMAADRSALIGRHALINLRAATPISTDALR
jgi:Flp pilus assembly protein CpaB